MIVAGDKAAGWVAYEPRRLVTAVLDRCGPGRLLHFAAAPYTNSAPV
jgi:hypothetical protein